MLPHFEVGEKLRRAARFPFDLGKGLLFMYPNRADEPPHIPSSLLDPSLRAAEKAKEYDNRGIGVVTIPLEFDSDVYKSNPSLKKDYAGYVAKALEAQKTIGYGRRVGIWSPMPASLQPRAREIHEEFTGLMREEIKDITGVEPLIVAESKTPKSLIERTAGEKRLMPATERLGYIAEDLDVMPGMDNVDPEDRALVAIMFPFELRTELDADSDDVDTAVAVGFLVNQKIDPMRRRIEWSSHQGIDEIRELESRRLPRL